MALLCSWTIIALLIPQLAIKVERAGLPLNGPGISGRFIAHWGPGSVTAAFITQRPPCCLQDVRQMLEVVKRVSEHQPVYLSVLPQGSVVHKVFGCGWENGTLHDMLLLPDTECLPMT